MTDTRLTWTARTADGRWLRASYSRAPWPAHSFLWGEAPSLLVLSPAVLDDIIHKGSMPRIASSRIEKQEWVKPGRIFTVRYLSKDSGFPLYRSGPGLDVNAGVLIQTSSTTSMKNALWWVTERDARKYAQSTLGACNDRWTYDIVSLDPGEPCN